MSLRNRSISVSLATLCFAIFFWSAATASAQLPSSGGLEPAAGEGLGTLDNLTVRPQLAQGVAYLVELTAPSAAAAYSRVIHDAGVSANTHDPRTAEIIGRADLAGREENARVSSQQSLFESALRSSAVDARILYRVKNVLNAYALVVGKADLARVAKLPGVKRIVPIEPEYPSSNSLSFLGVPKVWENSIGLPAGADGTGVKIAIIDTGIDYQHSNFGGTGLLTDYQANDRTIITDGFFPTAKVVGGTDFAGDAYIGSNAPVPDPDPMDCNGHGSHVAGIAAGMGVDAAGATYTGPYTSAGSYGSLLIPPGMAHNAQLYALRVFGCTGSTSLTVQAIDWAMDPNGDSNLSDHLDVINMSLGADFGSMSDTSAMAAEAASDAGVIVVAAAGNAGDTYLNHSSPAAGRGVISVAASTDDGIAGARLTVNAPGGIAGNYAAGVGVFTPTPPAPSGQTASIVAAIDSANAAGPLTTDGCTALTNAAAVAGNIALIDRGTCGFIVKAQNAQAAGAIGAIIVNNVAGDPTLTNLSGTAPPGPSITIPTMFISQADGNTIKAQLPGVNATMAATDAGDQLAVFSSRGPNHGVPFQLRPDVTAPGVSIVSTQTGVTCASGCLRTDPSGYLPGNQALVISGTSMATPHVAGIAALLRQLHPDWSTEEIKAALMNGASHPSYVGAGRAGLQYGAGRTGAGRVDAPASAIATTLAFSADDSGAVSLSFPSEVTGTQTFLRTARVENKGPASVTYDLSIATTVDAPGVSFSLPGGSTLTVPAGQATTLDVQMDTNASQMKHTRDVTVAPIQAAPGALAALGTLARAFLTEESANLIFSVSGVEKMRVPLYTAARAASALSVPGSITTGGAPIGSDTLPFSGTDVCTGTLGAGPTCTGTFPADQVSLASAFELQVANPLHRTAGVPASANIQYGGVAYDPATNLLQFGLSTYGDWASVSDTVFNVYIDNNQDGTWDRVLFADDAGDVDRNLFGGTGSGQDTDISFIFDLATSGVSTGTFRNRLSPAAIDSALFRNNVTFLAATPAQLGLTAGDTNFRWKVVTCPRFAPLCLAVNGFDLDEANGPYYWNYAAAAQGLNFAISQPKTALNGSSLPITWNVANMTVNGSLGALVLHHLNKGGTRAQASVLQGTPSADLAVTIAMSPVSPTLGQNATFTVTVTNNGSAAAAGVAVDALLPAGLTYVSDDGGGSYDSTTGLWSPGALASSTSATLHIVATVDSSDAIPFTVQRAGGTPLDTNPANDTATVTVSAPRQADLALTESVSSPTVLVGSPVSYTVTATNAGDDQAFSVNVQEAFPALPALMVTSSSASAGVFDSSTGVWNLAGLPKGGSAALTFGVNAPNMAGALTSQVTGSATTSDPNIANNSAMASTTVLSPASVSATMTVSGTPYRGNVLTYTITLANSASFDQQDNSGHELADVLPPSLTLVSANATAGTAVATIGTNTVTWDGVVPASGSVTITVTATISGAATVGGTISNQATVDYDADGNGTNEAARLSDDPAVAGASDPTSVTVISPATIASASKSVSGTFQIGGTVTYAVTFTNTGVQSQVDNPGDEFTDTLPSTLTLVSAVATSGTATTSGNVVHWNGSLAPAATETITITATINNTAVALATISNQGTVFFDADGNGTNESSVVTDDPAVAGASDPTSFVVISPATIASASKSVSGTFQIGGTVTYAVTFTNTGVQSQVDNPGDEFTDTLPSTLNLVSAVATSGTATTSGNVVHWNGSLAAGATETITITATINNTAVAFATISNQGTVFFDADGNGTNESSVVTDDPAVAGASDPTSFVVISPATIASVSKSVSGTFRIGGTVTYAVTFTNTAAQSQVDNPGDEFTDTLPSTLNLVSAVASSGTATTSGNVVHWNGSLAAGATETITITATINNTAVAFATISNQGTVFFDADGNGTNESTVVTDDPSTAAVGDATSFVVVSPSGLTATKSVSAPRPTPGTNVTYTVVITNNGPATQLDNAGDEFTDVLPAGLILLSATATSGTATTGGNTVHWNGTVVVGTPVTITIIARIQTSAIGTISNQGTLQFDGDGNGTNESTGTTDGPDGGATTFVVTPANDIPTLSPAALLVLTAMLALISLRVVRRD